MDWEKRWVVAERIIRREDVRKGVRIQYTARTAREKWAGGSPKVKTLENGAAQLGNREILGWGESGWATKRVKEKKV